MKNKSLFLLVSLFAIPANATCKYDDLPSIDGVTIQAPTDFRKDRVKVTIKESGLSFYLDKKGEVSSVDGLLQKEVDAWEMVEFQRDNYKKYLAARGEKFDADYDSKLQKRVKDAEAEHANAQRLTYVMSEAGSAKSHHENFVEKMEAQKRLVNQIIVGLCGSTDYRINDNDLGLPLTADDKSSYLWGHSFSDSSALKYKDLRDAKKPSDALLVRYNRPNQQVMAREAEVLDTVKYHKEKEKKAEESGRQYQY